MSTNTQAHQTASVLGATFLNAIMKASLTLALGFAVLPSSAFAQSADEILKRADDVRCPADSFAMTVDVESSDADAARFEVMLKGKDKTLIRTKRPSRDVGRNILMIEENMWAYIPNLKRAVRVSLNQKLTGQAANGDISRMRWHGDYTPSIEKIEANMWVIDLRANRKGLTYERIRVWVQQKSFHPQKAEYMTSQGKVLKNAEFAGYRKMVGALRPTEITIRDASDKSQFSRIVIREMRKEDFPESLFHQNSLK